MLQAGRELQVWVVQLQVLHQAFKSRIALHTAAIRLLLMLLLDHVTTDISHCSSTSNCSGAGGATARLLLPGACSLLRALGLGAAAAAA